MYKCIAITEQKACGFLFLFCFVFSFYFLFLFCFEIHQSDDVRFCHLRVIRSTFQASEVKNFLNATTSLSVRSSTSLSRRAVTTSTSHSSTGLPPLCTYALQLVSPQNVPTPQLPSDRPALNKKRVTVSNIVYCKMFTYIMIFFQIKVQHPAVRLIYSFFFTKSYID